MSTPGPHVPKLQAVLRKVLITPGFVDASTARVADALCEMLNLGIRNTPRWEYSGEQPLSEVIQYRKRMAGRSLAAALRKLDPMVQPVPTRFLLLGTRSRWTLLLSNLSTGDAGGSKEMGLSDALKTRAIQIASSESDDECYAQMFHVYQNGEEVRMIEVVEEEDGRYLFRNDGEPLSFEDTDKYKLRRKRDRLTREMVLRYLGKCDIRPYDVEFYRVNAELPAYLVERIDKDPTIKRRFVFTPVSELRR